MTYQAVTVPLHSTTHSYWHVGLTALSPRVSGMSPSAVLQTRSKHEEGDLSLFQDAGHMFQNHFYQK